MPPSDPDTRSTLLALYIPTDLDVRVEDARLATKLDRSKFIRDQVTRQARLPARIPGPLTAGPKVRRNVRWHPDEVAAIEAYAAAAWQSFGRRLGVEDAAVELLGAAIAGPVETDVEVDPQAQAQAHVQAAEATDGRAVTLTASTDLRALVAEALRVELEPVLALLRADVPSGEHQRTQLDTDWIHVARMGLDVALGHLRSARAALQGVGERLPPDPSGALLSVEAALSELAPYLATGSARGAPEQAAGVAEVDHADSEGARDTTGAGLASTLRAVRARRSLTQRAAAAAAGVSIATYQRAEQGTDLGAKTLQCLEAWAAG